MARLRDRLLVHLAPDRIELRRAWGAGRTSTRRSVGKRLERLLHPGTWEHAPDSGEAIRIRSSRWTHAVDCLAYANRILTHGIDAYGELDAGAATGGRELHQERAARLNDLMRDRALLRDLVSRLQAATEDAYAERVAGLAADTEDGAAGRRAIADMQRLRLDAHVFVGSDPDDYRDLLRRWRRRLAALERLA